MKKLIAVLLVLGFTMPVMAAEGEMSEDNVKCEEIFQGQGNKGVIAPPSEERPNKGPKSDHES